MTLKKELKSMLLKLFHKIERKIMLTNLFYDVSMSLLPTLGKDTRKKLHTNFLMNIDAKILNNKLNTLKR
jgi:hypothetical protein